MLDESFPEAAKGKAMAVFAVEDGEALEAHQAEIDAVLADVATVELGESVADPFSATTMRWYEARPRNEVPSLR